MWRVPLQLLLGAALMLPQTEGNPGKGTLADMGSMGSANDELNSVELQKPALQKVGEVMNTMETKDQGEVVDISEECVGTCYAACHCPEPKRCTADQKKCGQKPNEEHASEYCPLDDICYGKHCVCK